MSTHMIQRRFTTVDGRQVHYRIAGSGPALLLIHQSPQNSRMWLEMMARYADRYTVVAPDTPGFGHSDPLPGNPMAIADFGAATLRFLDAIGLQRCAVFGMHTGGLIAAWLAWAHPERVAALVVDGYAAFTPEESALYGDAYLPPFVPQWDGSHLRWLWARMREQKYFFPWYDGRAEAAMAIAPHTTASTHEAVMDVLDVGDAYRSGYAAAFRHNDHHWLQQLEVPAWLVYRHGDPLRAHAPRLQGLPDHVAVVDEPGGIPAMHDRMDGWLAQALAGEPDYAGSTTRDAPPGGAWRRRIFATGAGGIAAWERGGRGRLHLCLHAPGTRPFVPGQLPTGEEAWLLPDLPGHGASSECEGELDAASVVAAVLEVLKAGDASLPVLIEAHGAAAGYVPALVDVLGRRVDGVELHAPWLLEAGEQTVLLQGLPTTTIDRAGGHLGDAWQWERERHLMWPWLQPCAEARRLVAAPEPAQVHANVVELLRLGARLHTLLGDATAPGLAWRLRALAVPVRVVADAHDDYLGRAAALSAPTEGRP
ncbi:MAG: alpha/beta fold hydrolase [Luteimonas sp.]|nr:alpha/beta fold hydrolase [Luteimonas sp.]